MNRRDFLKSISALSVLALPLELSATLTIVDIKLLDGFGDALVTGKPYMENGQYYIPVTFEGDIWEYARLVDSDGREWHTDDTGQTWHCGLMSFDIPQEDVIQ